MKFIFGILSGVAISIITIIVINIVFLQASRNIKKSISQVPIGHSKNGEIYIKHISWVSSFRERSVFVCDYIKDDSYILTSLDRKGVESSFKTRYPKGIDQIDEVVSMFRRGGIQVNDSGGKFIGILTEDGSKILIPSSSALGSAPNNRH
jgi:hypothetical protein